jgi:hypothetical protein
MNQRLVQYSPEMEGPEGFQSGPLAMRARRHGNARQGVFNEGQVLELAAELLEARNATSLAAAVDRLVGHALEVLSATPPIAFAQAVRGALLRRAAQALPFGSSTSRGRSLAAAARLSGLELEGLSPEDKEFELAKNFVRQAAERVRGALDFPDRARVRALTFHTSDPKQEPNMHDIDRTHNEYENEQFEFGENEWSPEAGGGIGEAEEMELATELLSVTNEGELDRFLGDLVSRATKAVSSFVRSPIGQAVGGVLKGVAKKALPMAGTAIGGYFGGPLGAKIGAGVANAASDALGLEGEMSGEDREFEGAKQFVRMAVQTANQAAAAPPGADPRAVAQQAAIAAARQLAPGLLSSAATAAPAPAPALATRGAASGRWLRRGNKIVIFGA